MKTIEDVRQLAETKGGKCLTTAYKNSKTKYDFICSKGHLFSTSYGMLKQDHWCSECADTKRKTLEDVQKLARAKNCKCLATEYKNKATIYLTVPSRK